MILDVRKSGDKTLEEHQPLAFNFISVPFCHFSVFFPSFCCCWSRLLLCFIIQFLAYFSAHQHNKPLTDLFINFLLVPSSRSVHTPTQPWRSLTDRANMVGLILHHTVSQCTMYPLLYFPLHHFPCILCFVILFFIFLFTGVVPFLPTCCTTRPNCQSRRLSKHFFILYFFLPASSLYFTSCRCGCCCCCCFCCCFDYHCWVHYGDGVLLLLSFLSILLTTFHQSRAEQIIFFVNVYCWIIHPSNQRRTQVRSSFYRSDMLKKICLPCSTTATRLGLGLVLQQKCCVVLLWSSFIFIWWLVVVCAVGG